MVYRDDDLAQLRTQVNAQKERLDKFEALYEKEGVKRRKSLISKFFVVVWKVITTPVKFLWSGLCKGWLPIALVLLVVGGAFGGGYALWHQEDSFSQHRAYDARVQEREEREQCAGFCETHGYRFYEDRRGSMCYCGTENSEEIAFIIDVRTSENWIISDGHE